MKMLFFILLLLMPKLLLAQTDLSQDNVPTDNELFAAYCLGVERESEVYIWSSDRNYAKDPKLNQMVQNIDRKKMDFLAYLVAKNVMGEPGILIAAASGEKDSRDTMNAMSTICPLTAPSYFDREKNGETWYRNQVQLAVEHEAACLNALPYYVRQLRCSKPSNLPF